jgi:hypothetical protein
MKIIIAGSRILQPTQEDVDTLDSYKYLIKEVVSGCARGIDKFGESWAEWNKIPIKRFPADWESFGQSAGIKRNKQMAEYADGLIAFIKNNSSGTKNMIQQAEINNLWIRVISK